MKAKTKITLVYNGYNEYGEQEQEELVEFKCHIVELQKKSDAYKSNDFHTADMNIIVEYKNLSAYNDLLNDNSLSFIFGGKKYKMLATTVIFKNNGKVKAYDIELVEDTNAN